MITVEEICAILEELAPAGLAETWDNSGLLLGNRQIECTGILLSLDASLPVLEEALSLNCNTIVVHHPVIFQPLKKIDTGTAEGLLLQRALAEDVAIIACHTNFDSTINGVSDYLGSQLGLVERQPLLPSGKDAEGRTGLGCIGRYPQSLNGNTFLQHLLEIIQLPGVFVAGALPETIRTVALCGGSGSDFAQLARSQGADVYLSAEIKHHVALWAVANRFCIIDGGHYATEKPAVSLLARWLKEHIAAKGWHLPVTEAQVERAPFVFMATEKREEG